MKRLFYIYLISIFSINPIKTYSQDTVQLQPVNILGDRVDAFTNSINVEKADSFTIANSLTKNLAEILEGSSGIQIRSYGYGGVSMMAMRNGNSYQTAVLWNGFNLQDPLNGGVSLTMLPGFFIDNIEMHKGGETSLFGSGAMGGSIFLNSSASLNKGFQFEAYSAMGSFGSYQGGICLGYSNKRLASKIKFFHKQVENNFPFINNAKIGKPIDHQNNAALNQQGLMQQNTFVIKKNQLISLDFWLLRSDNEVPELMSQTSLATGSSLTNNFRSTLSYTAIFSNLKIKARLATIYNSLYFNDISSNTNYLHKSFSQISEAEADLKINENNKLMLGFNNTFDQGISESLSPEAKRNRSSIFASWKWSSIKNFSLMTNLRQEFLPHTKIPFIYSFKANYKFKFGIKLFASYAKTHRLPTFNDLYWVDYFSTGNPNLNAEWGNSKEFGAIYNFGNKKFKFKIKANYFQSFTNDLIQWVPYQGIWTPQNFEQVSSEGLESGLLSEIKISNSTKFRLQSDYSFLKSIIKKSASANPEEIIGKQLIFVPKHKGNILARLIIKRYFIEYQHFFTGKIYTTTDQTESLNAYSTANFSTGYNFQIKKSSLNLTFRIQNLLNSTYQLMPGYAMPGIHYEISLKYSLNQSKQ